MKLPYTRTETKNVQTQKCSSKTNARNARLTCKRKITYSNKPNLARCIYNKSICLEK